MTAWNRPDLAETPFDLRLLDWLRANPGRSTHQIAVSLGVTGPHDRSSRALHVVEVALKRLRMRSLVRYEDKASRRGVTRYWSAS
jgi:hypothetical protein